MIMKKFQGGAYKMSVNHEKQMNLDLFSKDKDIIYQIKKSREDRINGRMYDRKQGLDYLQRKIKNFERGQNL